MERVSLFVVFLMLISRGAPEKGGELSTAFLGETVSPATVSEKTEERGRTDPNLPGSTTEVRLNQTASSTDGELQSNTTHLLLPEKGLKYYQCLLLVLLCFSPYVVAFVSVAARCCFSRQCHSRWQCGGSDVELVALRKLNSSASETPSAGTSED